MIAATRASTRPNALPVLAETIPAELKELDQWVGWRYEKRRGKWTKPPLNVRTGTYASSTDPQTWSSFDETMAAHKADGYDGIGVSFQTDEQRTGIDLDHAIENGAIAEWARKIIDEINSYTERSPGGTGIRIFVKANKPHGVGAKKNDIEVYDHSRYLTVTGQHLEGTPATIEARQTEVDALCARIWPPKPKVESQKRSHPAFAMMTICSTRRAPPATALSSPRCGGAIRGHMAEIIPRPTWLCAVCWRSGRRATGHESIAYSVVAD